MEVSFLSNGRAVSVEQPPMTPLAEVLRETLLLTGTKTPCNEGFCGACTVLVDEEPVVSCLTPLASVANRRVDTVEGLGTETSMSSLQQAMIDRDAVQCGMCFPGMLITLTAFLRDRQTAPSEAELRSALTGNVCRCTGYQAIIEAALAVVRSQAV
jgi:carbon-monoxide dehydrogenase small subunit